MNKRTERLIESFLLISLPVAILAGCAGSGETTPVSEPATTISNQQPLAANQHMDSDKSYPILTEYRLNHAAKSNSHKVSRHISLDSSPLIDMDTQLAILGNLEDKAGELPEKQEYYFGLNNYQVDSVDYATLQQHAAYLMQHPTLMLTVGGYTDTSGNQNHNQRLSEQRAMAVASLLRKFGAPDKQLLVMGYGEIVNPLKTGSDKEARKVELLYSDLIRLGKK